MVAPAFPLTDVGMETLQCDGSAEKIELCGRVNIMQNSRICNMWRGILIAIHLSVLILMSKIQNIGQLQGYAKNDKGSESCNDLHMFQTLLFILDFLGGMSLFPHKNRRRIRLVLPARWLADNHIDFHPNLP